MTLNVVEVTLGNLWQSQNSRHFVQASNLALATSAIVKRWLCVQTLKPACCTGMMRLKTQKSAISFYEVCMAMAISVLRRREPHCRTRRVW